MNLKSPITKGTVTLLKKISVSFIIEGYLKTFGLNTSKNFSSLDYLSLYRCDDTGYEFYYPFDVAGDENFYNFFQEKYDWYYQKEKWEYDQTLKIVNFKGAKVLEIGCGNGYFLKKALNENAKVAEGLEFNSHAVSYCQSEGLNVSNKNLSEIKKENYYDIICSFQVLEHISNISEFIIDAMKALKTGGLFVIAVPNNDSFIKYDNNPILNLPPHHMGLWTTDSILNLKKIIPVKNLNIYYEPLQEYHIEWYQSIIENKYLPQFISRVIKITRLNKLHTLYIRLFKKNITGHTLLAIIKKK